MPTVPPCYAASAEHLRSERDRVQLDEEVLLLCYLPGVGSATAEAIIQEFGSGNVQDVLNSDDGREQLSDIRGISSSMAYDIKEAWDDYGRESLRGLPAQQCHEKADVH
jgi:ERCC4-type nuclease